MELIIKFKEFIKEYWIFDSSDDDISSYLYNMMKKNPGKIAFIESEADLISMRIGDDIFDFHDGRLFLNEEEIRCSKRWYRKLKDKIKSIERWKIKIPHDSLESSNMSTKNDLKKKIKNLNKYN